MQGTLAGCRQRGEPVSKHGSMNEGELVSRPGPVYANHRDKYGYDQRAKHETGQDDGGKRQ